MINYGLPNSGTISLYDTRHLEFQKPSVVSYSSVVMQSVARSTALLPALLTPKLNADILTDA